MFYKQLLVLFFRVDATGRFLTDWGLLASSFTWLPGWLDRSLAYPLPAWYCKCKLMKAFTAVSIKTILCRYFLASFKKCLLCFFSENIRIILLFKFWKGELQRALLWVLLLLLQPLFLFPLLLLCIFIIIPVSIIFVIVIVVFIYMLIRSCF